MINDFESFLIEHGKGLWHNIRAKKASGKKPARKGSRAYKKAVAAAKELNESYKSIGLSEPKVYSPGITYEITDKMLKEFQSQSGSSEDEIIDSWIGDLNLKSGEIFSDTEEFVVSGITTNGNIIYIEQQGEFDMYGGSYDPKFSKPIVTINNIDIINYIIDIFKNHDGIDYTLEISGKLSHKIPDFMRVDVYGYLLNKKNIKTFITAGKYGL